MVLKKLVCNSEMMQAYLEDIIDIFEYMMYLFVKVKLHCLPTPVGSPRVGWMVFVYRLVEVKGILVKV